MGISSPPLLALERRRLQKHLLPRTAAASSSRGILFCELEDGSCAQRQSRPGRLSCPRGIDACYTPGRRLVHRQPPRQCEQLPWPGQGVLRSGRVRSIRYADGHRACDVHGRSSTNTTGPAATAWRDLDRGGASNTEQRFAADAFAWRARRARRVDPGATHRREIRRLPEGRAVSSTVVGHGDPDLGAKPEPGTSTNRKVGESAMRRRLSRPTYCHREHLCRRAAFEALMQTYPSGGAGSRSGQRESGFERRDEFQHGQQVGECPGKHVGSA